MDAALENYNTINCTQAWLPNGSLNYDSENISSCNTSIYGREKSTNCIFGNVIEISLLVICVFGAAGNGIVIWLLGFCIKRNPFIIYILNLAVADFGLLASLVAVMICDWFLCLDGLASSYLKLGVTFLFTYNTAQFLLTAIGINRCVAVFFPLWYQWRRPQHLSTIACVLIWSLSLVLTANTYSLMHLWKYETEIPVFFHLIVNAVVCLPAITIATVALFIKVCFQYQQDERRELSTLVLLILIFFLLFAFPFNVVAFHGLYNVPPCLSEFAYALSCLNSGAPPVIYFLVGRQRKSTQRESMKMLLQGVFEEEEGCTEETPVTSQN